MEHVRLSIRNIDKSFSVPVLRAINLSIRHGEIHAIVGENGAGKSTLANILAGNLLPDAGELVLDGLKYAPANPGAAYSAGISCAAQELSCIGTLSVAENISMRNLPHTKYVIARDRLHAYAESQLQRVGLSHISPNLKAEQLGLAERQLLELAKALSPDCRVLILDEPTAALNATQTTRLHHIITDLAAAGVSVIYISHRLEDVLAVADTISVMRDGQVVSCAPAEEMSVSALVEQMTGRDHQESGRSPAPPTDKAPVLSIENITTTDLPKPISFDCHKGEIIGFAGLAGSGRSELLSALFGLVPLSAGCVKRITSTGETAISSASQAVRLGMGYLAEDRQSMGLFAGQSLLKNMMLPGAASDRSALRLIDRSLEKTTGTELVTRLAIKCDDLDQDIAQLSGGNQQKALIARWLHCDSDIFIFDEPTRGVDVATKNAIYELLFEMQRRGKTVLIASSEIEELMTVCHRILVLSDRKFVATFRRGDWSEQSILVAAFSEFTKKATQSRAIHSATQSSSKSSGP